MRDKKQIFLSYAYEDREQVGRIARKLEEEGYQSWIDYKSLLPGQDWQVEIRNALKQSDYVLVFLTENSVSKKGYIQREIKSAISLADERPEGSIFLIPVLLDKVDVPHSLQHIQWVELYKEDGWEKLKRALDIEKDWQAVALDVLKTTAEKLKKPEKHIFVAMPFGEELEDVYYYGISMPVKLAGFKCVRIDKTSFTGDILSEIKDKIEKASAVIGVLDTANPNVSLEIGYAWGRGVPTVLLIKDAKQIPFDLRGQKCIVYDSIRHLEDALMADLNRLLENGDIHQ